MLSHHAPEAAYVEGEGRLAGGQGEQAVAEHVVAERPVLVCIRVACAQQRA